VLQHDLLARSEPTPWVRSIGLVDTTGGKYVVRSYRITYAMTQSASSVAAIAKIGLVSQAEAGAVLAPNIRVPFAPTLCSVHSFTTAWSRFLRSIPAAGAASIAASAARGAGMPGLGGITSMFSGLARGFQRSQQPQGPPAPQLGNPAVTVSAC
jgi:hypothetical protein